MVEKGSLVSMFSTTIRMCVGLKLYFYQANGIFGFGGLNLFSEWTFLHITCALCFFTTLIKWVFISSDYNHVLCFKIAHSIS
jgi:hypothetical protein